MTVAQRVSAHPLAEVRLLAESTQSPSNRPTGLFMSFGALAVVLSTLCGLLYFTHYSLTWPRLLGVAVMIGLIVFSFGRNFLYRKEMFEMRVSHNSLSILRTVLHIAAIVSILSGLIPLQLAHSALPAPVAELVEALLPEPPAAQAATTLTLSISTGSDDAAQSMSNGSVSLTGAALNLPFSTTPTTQTIGLRFTSLTIPQGATINSAYMQFTASGSDSTTTINLLVRGQAADNAPTFTTATNNLSNRPTTNASIAWSSVSVWAAGDAGIAQRTPELKTVIQEIVNRSGWVSGNSLVLLLTDNGTTLNNIRRRASSYDSSPSAPPKLIIDYDLPPAPTLHIHISSAPTTVHVGDLLTYTLTLTNEGPTSAANVVVRELLPVSVDYFIHTASSGVYAPLSGDWSLPSVPVGSQVLTITVQVK